MKIAFLANTLAGYSSKCLEALAKHGHAVLAYSVRPVVGAPFAEDQVSPAGVISRASSSLPNGDALLRELSDFQPDVLAIVGWNESAYRNAARHLSPRPLRVLCMDNQWLGTPKQWIGILSSAAYIRPLFDVAFLPGDRQAAFAKRLGFRDRQIWYGYYTCDHSSFLSPEQGADHQYANSFLFVGRLVEAKGVDILMAGYRSYRSRDVNAWPLVICGTGPLERQVRGVSGVELHGFVQPRDLPSMFRRAGCLLLPSIFEPWGVVVHEAASAGLPIICSTACGAAPHLVEDGYNGFLVGPGDSEGLSAAMLRFVKLSEVERAAMGMAGRSLSFRYTPERWAQTFISRSLGALASPMNSSWSP